MNEEEAEAFFNSLDKELDAEINRQNIFIKTILPVS